MSREIGDKFKSQLRADAEEFKPSFGLIHTNNVYYPQTIPSYQQLNLNRPLAVNYVNDMVDTKTIENNESLDNVTNFHTDGCETQLSSDNSLPMRNSDVDRKTDSKPLSLNPNAQEFIPRSWMNYQSNKAYDNNDKNIKGIQFGSDSVNEVKTQLKVTLAANSNFNVEGEKSIDNVKSKIDIEHNSRSKYNNKSTKGLIGNKGDKSTNKVSKTAKTVTSSKFNKTVNNKDQQFDQETIIVNNDTSIDQLTNLNQFTFKDKLLGVPSSNCSVTNEEGDHNNLVQEAETTKDLDVQDNKIGNDEKNGSESKQNDAHSSNNNFSNSLNETKTKTNVSWAQRLKNSTSNKPDNKCIKIEKKTMKEEKTVGSNNNSNAKSDNNLVEEILDNKDNLYLYKNTKKNDSNEHEHEHEHGHGHENKNKNRSKYKNKHAINQDKGDLNENILVNKDFVDENKNKDKNEIYRINKEANEKEVEIIKEREIVEKEKEIVKKEKEIVEKEKEIVKKEKEIVEKEKEIAEKKREIKKEKTKEKETKKEKEIEIEVQKEKDNQVQIEYVVEKEINASIELDNDDINEPATELEFDDNKSIELKKGTSLSLSLILLFKNYPLALEGYTPLYMDYQDEKDSNSRNKNWNNSSHNKGSYQSGYYQNKNNSNRRDKSSGLGRKGNNSNNNNNQSDNVAGDNSLNWIREERRIFRLESSADSWVVKQKEQKSTGDQYDNQLRQYRAILNKLTVEKFDKLYDQIIAVGVNTEEEATGLLKLIFDKATTQHHFIQMYVELCDKLRQHLKEDTTIETRRILVDLCQELFIENLSEMTLPDTIQNEEEIFEWQLKYKNKMKGNMIFMASLVKKKVIASTVVLMCMDELLHFHLPHHLEALCVFLQHVGPFLDSEKWKHYDSFDQLFKKFQEFGNNSEVPIRLRFLINDVIDCRKANWQLKNKREGPMMLDDLKSKIDAERAEVRKTHTSPQRTQKYNKLDTKVNKYEQYNKIDKYMDTNDKIKSSKNDKTSYQKNDHTNLHNNHHLSNRSNNNNQYSHNNNNNQINSYKKSTLINDITSESQEDFINECKFLTDVVKQKLNNKMDSLILSHDLEEFYSGIKELNIPKSDSAHVYKYMFLRMSEYKLKDRYQISRGIISMSIYFNDQDYMNGESAKDGILILLHPESLSDILIDIPQFKNMVMSEFINDYIPKYDPDNTVFNQEFIDNVTELLK